MSNENHPPVVPAQEPPENPKPERVSDEGSDTFRYSIIYKINYTGEQGQVGRH